MLRPTLPAVLALALAACGDSTPGRDVESDATTTTDAADTVDATSDATAPDATDASDATTTDATATDTTADSAEEVSDTSDDTGVDAGDTSDDTADTGSGDVCVVPDTADTTPTEVVDPGCDFAPDPEDGGFDDHTITHIDSNECFFAYAGPSSHDPVVVKFVIPDFAAEDAPLRFYENGFYQLHDEWYWFRLLNGHGIPRLTNDPAAVPVQGTTYATVTAIYSALAGAAVRPLDLVFYALDNRLYSPHFYDLCGFTSPPNTNRFFGVGSLVHYAANPDRRYPGEIWGFELEYPEVTTIGSIETYFHHLERLLPATITDHIVWISRSTSQDATAGALKASTSAYKNRVLTYNDLVVDGAVETYNPGIAAGYVHVMPDSWSEADIEPDEIVVLPRVPDDVPPTRAIVSAVPQTRLAHVNLLAKSRGTPNAYVGGILEWGQLGSWDWQHRPIIVEMTGDEENGAVRWKPIKADTNGQYTDYATYKALLTLPVRHIAQVPDLDTAPYTVSLTEGTTADMAGLVPLTGGKCAGFLSFLDVPGMVTPPEPMCITVRAYLEHVADLVPIWKAMVADPEFADTSPSSAGSNVRYLMLEGEDGFREANAGNPGALAWEEDFKASHTTGVLAQVLAAGGVHDMIRKKAMNPTTLAALRAVLEQRYAFLAPTQGIRFRSSSTAEDVIGFNGAGLHDSNTGFLDPSLARDPADRKKTIEWAIKKTWASYWNYNAFEERRIGQIDHFEGSMAVAVHPRFDDDKELANGVVTHYYSTYTPAPEDRMVVNIQAGPQAITNPGGSTAAAEIDEVRQVGDGTPTIRRLARSDLVDGCTLLLSDEELLHMFELSKTHTRIWLDAENAKRPAAERNKTVILDMEMKRMAAGWPELTSGEITPEHLLFRQSRVLDSPPVVRATADPWLGASFPITAYMPQDLRTAAEKVVASACSSEYFEIRVYKIFSQAGVAEQFPFVTSPFVYKVYVGYKKDAPGFDWPTVAYWLSRGSMTIATADPAVGVRLTLPTNTANTLGTDAIDIDPDGSWRIRRGDQQVSGTCTQEDRPLYQSPADFLRGLMNAP
ncbi:MAG: PEP/pyruvate-binding domain-containing protein [Myxococcota bacterium]